MITRLMNEITTHEHYSEGGEMVRKRERERDVSCRERRVSEKKGEMKEDIRFYLFN